MKTKMYIEKYQKKIIELSDIILNSGDSYEEIVVTIKKLVEEHDLSPVKGSGQNGRRPALYNRYKIIEKKKDYADVLNSIKLLHSRFAHQYYLSHPDQYIAIKDDIDCLNDFLWRRSDELIEPMSINERSFSIFGKEKLLKSLEHQFTSYFKLQNFTFQDLNTYHTPEPFFEYIHPRTEDGEILIIENKDTWYTLRKLMKEENMPVLFGIPFKVLIYGEGKKITRQSGRLLEYKEEVLKEKRHTFYYFGDLDYEGIFIYQEAKEKNPEVDIRLLTDAYETMLTEVLYREYPETRDHRKPRADLELFLSNFSEANQEKIIGILEKGQYIPQEVLNYKILKSKMKGMENV